MILMLSDNIINKVMKLVHPGVLSVSSSITMEVMLVLRSPFDSIRFSHGSLFIFSKSSSRTTVESAHSVAQ